MVVKVVVIVVAVVVLSGNSNGACAAEASRTPLRRWQASKQSRTHPRTHAPALTTARALYSSHALTHARVFPLPVGAAMQKSPPPALSPGGRMAATMVGRALVCTGNH